MSHKYLSAHSSVPSGALSWLEKQTNIRTNFPQMLCGPVQGQFLKMLVEISGARRALEIGTFTGYSAICIASGLPQEGHLDALEINDELEDLILQGWDKAGVSQKVSLHICNALDFLRESSGGYDFIYIDANKREYCEYYRLSMALLRPGALMVVDDVCMGGKVFEASGGHDAQTEGLRLFNDMVASDPTVEQVMLPLRDAVTIIRKLI